jgi:hypothetical protein
MKLFCAFSTVAKLAALCFAVGLVTGLYLGTEVTNGGQAARGADTRTSAPALPGAAHRLAQGKEANQCRFTPSFTWSSTC